MAVSTERAIVSAQIPAAVRDRLEQLAAEADRTLSAEVRRALIRHVDRQAPPEPEGDNP